MKHFALVQPAGHSLPELDALGRDAEARPVRRTRHRSALVLALEARDALIEIGAPLERPALRRRPGSDLTAARPGREVRVGLVLGHRRRPSLHPDLHLE